MPNRAAFSGPFGELSGLGDCPCGCGSQIPVGSRVGFAANPADSPQVPVEATDDIQLSELDWLKSTFPNHFERHRCELVSLRRELGRPTSAAEREAWYRRITDPFTYIDEVKPDEQEIGSRDAATLQRRLSASPGTRKGALPASSGGEAPFFGRGEAGRNTTGSGDSATEGLDRGSPPISLDTTETSGSRSGQAARLERVATRTFRDLNADQIAERERIVGALLDSGVPMLLKAGGRIGQCSSSWSVQACKTNAAKSRVVPVDRCKHRLCFVCNRIRAAKWKEKARVFKTELDAEGRTPKFLTLTLRSKPGDAFKPQLRKLQESFEKFRHSKAFKDHLRDPIGKARGWLAFREVTGGNQGSFHVHMHLILDCDYWDWRDIREAWFRATGTSWRIDIREAKENWGEELIKYPFKTAKVPTDRIAEVAKGIYRARLVSAGGAWYGRMSDEDLDEVPGGIRIHWVCWELFERMIYSGDRWANDVLIAVLRIRLLAIGAGLGTANNSALVHLLWGGGGPS